MGVKFVLDFDFLILYLFYFGKKVEEKEILRQVVRIHDHQPRLFNLDPIITVIDLGHELLREIGDFVVRGLGFLFARNVILIEIYTKLKKGNTINVEG